MERRDFVTNLSVALALACTGGLAACSKSDSGDPDPNPGGGGGALLTANLGSELQNTGDYKIGGGVILIRIAAGNTVSSFAALSSTCTHQGCTVARFNSSTNLIECNAPCGHGSRYTTSGAVNTGPATAALAKRTITISGSTLTVT
ncbi:QcrA and Rieske domain-containing protein [Chitinophaga japonensis]|uniref:Rieske Fe-S protein n=1 Tax=Chitinophaga japonensis TaxID=104662 RepID=A0A562SMA1_CHIJA|nr:Rieske 2Fe-2S domain-containing protein [Chitinophaga japonensis]TWI82449.1 Rieske Fe-S protein [Chitinophaga japonensis]